MYLTRRVTDDIHYIGCDDRKITLFEGVYSINNGMSYNSYMLLDEKKVIFDTVDKAVTEQYIENVRHVLGDNKLDYIVVHHAEPDHSASFSALIRMYPDAVVICNVRTKMMLEQFYSSEIAHEIKFKIVKEGEALSTGKHTLKFILAPFVHWPEVMVTYDETDKVLFSADAFGSFGSMDGALFVDEGEFNLDEARRYYCNIVGKYGTQVQTLLKKASALDIAYICPLHSYVWRKDIGGILDKYTKWSLYEAEEKGVVIVTSSVYGNTDNAAQILASKLVQKGAKVKMLDVSIKHNDVVIAECFKYSTFVFASPTYNAGIFVRMEEVIRDIVAHGIKGRRYALIENGSWAPLAAKQMEEILSTCKDMTCVGALTLRGAITEEGLKTADELAEALMC